MNRKLRDRLSKLETTQGDGLTRAEQMMLVAILGRRDGMFWPWRWQPTDRIPHCEIRRRQREYLAGQVGVGAKADGSHQWKDSHSMRQKLISAGLITATHSSGQITSVFLTPQGEAYARALVGSRLHTMESGRMVLVFLKIKSEQTSVKAVRESVLLGTPEHGNPESWADTTELVLPLLTAGMITATSDTQGRIAYTPVPGATEPKLITVDIESHPDFDDCYVGAFNDERIALSCAEARDGAEIFIPLPATGWGWPVHFEESSNVEK